jgi:hypothetical protein
MQTLVSLGGCAPSLMQKSCYATATGVRILGIIVAEAVIIILIIRKDASYTDQNNDIYDHRA